MNFLGTTTEIPDDLFIRHQEGRVVFFCGAGISCGAGLPNFKDLVSQTRVKAMLPDSEEFASLLQSNQLDTLYQQMEMAMGGGREGKVKLRRITADLLKTKADNEYDSEAFRVHESILKLSQIQCVADRRRRKRIHLVTTNYDNLFDLSAKRIGLGRMRNYAASLIPAPRDFRWDGVVYLHGKLDAKPDEDNLNSLIISSGDFGIAYLTERWASRFLTGLFSDYTVCFVGYRVNDPIIRYMMDAIAAERVLGENRKAVYAFCGCVAGGERELKDQWAAKGIEVIPYELSTNNDHSQLRAVLVAWSELYSRGYEARDELVRKIGRVDPKENRELAKRISKLLIWALSDKSGAMARVFAEMEPLPSLEWFEYLDNADGLLPLSVNDGLTIVQKRMLQWLKRHLGNVELLKKLVSRKGQIGKYAVSYLEQFALELFSKEGPDCDNEEVRISGLPTLWILWLESQRKSRIGYTDGVLADCVERLRHADFVSGVLQLLSSLVQPIVRLQPVDSDSMSEWYPGDDWRRYFSVSFSIVAEDPFSFLERGLESRLDALPFESVSLFESALELVCAIRRELGDERVDSDYSYLQVEDLAGGNNVWKNASEGWLALVFLLKNKWGKLLDVDHKRATRIAKNWFRSEHPIFKRLAICCAAIDSDISFNKTMRWFVSDPEQFLFGQVYIREIVNLIKSKGWRLKAHENDLLSKCLSKYFKMPDAGNAARCAMLIDVFKGSGVSLSKECMAFYTSYKLEHDEFSKRDKKKDGISTWDESVVYDVAKEAPKMPPLPKNDKEFSLWMMRYETLRKYGVIMKDPWRMYCDDAVDCLEPLRRLSAVSSEGDYPVHALGVLVASVIRKGQSKEMWDNMMELSRKLSDELKFSEESRYSALVQSVGENMPNDKQYLDNASSLLLRAYNASDRVIEEVMDGIVRSWYATLPAQNEGLKEPYRELFTIVAKAGTSKLEIARRRLFHQITSLVAVDKAWANENLLPRLDWDKNVDYAVDAWAEVLRLPSFSDRLMKELKPYFVDTARHFSELGRSQEKYASFLFALASGKCGEFEPWEYADIIRTLPEEGRGALAGVICRELDYSKDQRDSFWMQKAKPFLTKCWPAESKLFSADVAGQILSGVVYCDKAYADAVDVLVDKANERITLKYAISRLANPPKGTKARCQAYPEASIKLLSCIQDDDVDFSMAVFLRKCLSQLLISMPELAKSQEFMRLDYLVKAQGR